MFNCSLGDRECTLFALVMSMFGIGTEGVCVQIKSGEIFQVG